MSDEQYKIPKIKKICIDKIKDKKANEHTNLMIEFLDLESADYVRSFFKNIENGVN